MTAPDISIVVTCYNYGAFVAEAIESALSQTERPVEVVVVDDGSTDGSAAVIDRFADRITLVRQANQGHIAACNNGFGRTSGNLVVFLDADDVLKPTLVAELKRVWRPDCAKIQYDLDIIDRNGDTLASSAWQFAPDYDAAVIDREFARSSTYRWPVTAGNAYARRLLDQCLPLQVALAPDGYLNTVAPLYGPVLTVPRALACYRIHGGNGWSPSADDLHRLSRRIEHRYAEIDYLREHAAACGRTLAPGNPLDHELPFITYRLVATRFGIAYPGSENESSATLWRAGLSHLRSANLPVKAKLAHAAWLTLLRSSPRPLGRLLVQLRSNRRLLKARLLAAMQRHKPNLTQAKASADG